MDELMESEKNDFPHLGDFLFVFPHFCWELHGVWAWLGPRFSPKKHGMAEWQRELNLVGTSGVIFGVVQMPPFGTKFTYVWKVKKDALWVKVLIQQVVFWVSTVPDEQISPTVSFAFKPKLRWQAVRRNQMFEHQVPVLFVLGKDFLLQLRNAQIFPTKKTEADLCSRLKSWLMFHTLRLWKNWQVAWNSGIAACAKGPKRSAWQSAVQLFLRLLTPLSWVSMAVRALESCSVLSRCDLVGFFDKIYEGSSHIHAKVISSNIIYQHHVVVYW